MAPPMPVDGAAPSPRDAPPGARAAAPAPAPAPVLEITVAGGAPVAGWSTPIRAHAAGAPLSALLVEIGRVAQVRFVLDAHLGARPVALHVESATAEVVVRELVGTFELVLVRHEDVATVTTREAAAREMRRRWLEQSQVEIETHLFPIGDPWPARDLALAYCHMFASSRGAATTLGGDLVVRDSADVISVIDILVRETTPTPRSDGPVSAGAPPPAQP